MRFFAFALLFAFIYYFANGLVDGFLSEKNQVLSKFEILMLKLAITVLVILVLSLISKCGCTVEEYASPSGKTSIEHYEPRF